MKKSILIASAMLLSALAATGCGDSKTPINDKSSSSQVSIDALTDNNAALEKSVLDSTSEEFNTAALDFSVGLFKESLSKDIDRGKNGVISPQSVMLALGMTANGASGQTLEQMQSVLCGGMDMSDFNENMLCLINACTDSDEIKFNIADSIWIKDNGDITVNADFLDTAAKYYNAQVFAEEFSGNTCDKINSWVNEKTDSMIPSIIDEIPEYAVMYLVNAISFDAQWETPYEDDQIVEDGKFSNSSGAVETVPTLYSTENIYLSCDNAQGFIKNYKGGKYAFVGLLPNEGVTLSQLIRSIDGDTLADMYKSREYCDVYVSIPEFTSDYDTELREYLVGMGMSNAFTEAADFSAMGHTKTGCLYISRVLHKTHIEVNRKGTKAAAATAVEMTDEAAMIDTEQPKMVYLDRPFVCMIIDTESGIPVFMGEIQTTES